MSKAKGYRHSRGKHTVVNGVAYRTPEAAHAARMREYTFAGIPLAFASAEETDADIACDMSQNPPARQAFTQVVGSAINEDALAFVMHHARRAIDDGNTALVVSITDLIDLKLNKAQASEWADMLDRIRNAGFFACTFADTLANKMTKPTALAIHQARLGTSGWSFYHVDQSMRLEPERFGPLAAESEKFKRASFE